MPVVRSFFLNSSTKISDNFSPPEGKINENRDNKDSERFTDFTRVTFTVLKGLKIENEYSNYFTQEKVSEKYLVPQRLSVEVN